MPRLPRLSKETAPKRGAKPASKAEDKAASKGAAKSAVPRARLEVDARRDQLVKLGIDLFSTRTYDDVSIDELARAAGISKGLLYHYFQTKRDFYVATVHEGSRQLLARTATSGDLPPLERLSAGLDAYLDYVEEHGPAYAALLRGGIGADPEVASIVDATRAQFCERLMEGAPVDTKGPLVRTALRAWIAFVETASLDWFEKRSVSRVALRDLVISVLTSTMGVAAAMEGKTDDATAHSG